MGDICEQFNALRAKGEKIFTRLRFVPFSSFFFSPQRHTPHTL